MPRDFERIAARLAAEKPITAAEAARMVPCNRNRRGHCSAAAVVRWIVRGREGIHLDGLRGAGRSWTTSREALTRFFVALSEQGQAEDEQVEELARRFSTAGQREREQRARAAMARMGMG